MISASRATWWEQALTSNLKLDGGIAYSKEHDYRSESANIGVSQDFNGHNTTLSAAVNYESDSPSDRRNADTAHANERELERAGCLASRSGRSGGITQS